MQPIRRWPAAARAALRAATLLALTACAADARVARLERRVDSLAVTLTALANPRREGAAPVAAETVTVSRTGAATAGDRGAPVVIIEFTDYQCPFCSRHFRTTLPELQRDYVRTGKAQYVVRDLPLTELHPHALAAATASRCAAAQGDRQFWRFHDALFARQPEITDTLFPRLARELGFDVAQFAACRRSPATDRAVALDLAEARRLGLTGTPAFVIGVPVADSAVRGVVIRGAYPSQVFRQVIDSALRLGARQGR